MSLGRFPTATGYVDDTRSQNEVILSGIVVVSSIIYIITTAKGIGILPDSVAYMRIGSAIHFAPFYTWVLQGLTLLNIDIVTAAWWLGWVLAVVNNLLIYSVLMKTCRSLRWTAAGMALIVLHPVYVEFHAVAMTEALYIALALTSIILFRATLERGGMVRNGVLGGAIGAAMLTRFAAAPLLPAFIIARLIFGGESFRRKIIDCLVIIAFCLLVFGLWVAWGEFTGGRSTGRDFDLRGRPDWQFWLTSIGSASTMLLPGPVGFPARVLFLTALSGVVLWAATDFVRVWRPQLGDKKSEAAQSVPVVCGLIALLYGLFLMASVFIQYRLNLTGRFLLPLYLFTTLAVVTGVSGRGRAAPPGRGLVITLCAFACVIIASNVLRTSIFAMSAYQDGIGYVQRSWSTSPILRSVADLPPNATIYSNAPDLVAFRLRREARYLPAHFNHITGREDPQEPFVKQMKELRNRLDSSDTYVVFIDGVDWRDYLLTERDLLRSVPLVAVAKLPDGRIYEGALIGNRR